MRSKGRLEIGYLRELCDSMATEQKPVDLEMLDDVFGREGREDILSTFISHSGVLIPRMETAFEERQISTVIDIAHQIKGMCASIYASDCSGRALAVEQLAKQSDPDWKKISDAYAILKRDFSDLLTYLRSVS
jgi:HPt (histidine-containing phosphotransfer) domain-containing protein